ncbi:DUF2142 domain-containing protein [Paraburkholderia dilworthii]|uniref:DUF2142 domain-containing protein n=1 Tax=Paraburkholderia dilworthii TaxID=948106 RepID=UPI00041DE8F5|nr:DUF2142 domain-containing protein [Paraburkholderia dilworthii]
MNRLSRGALTFFAIVAIGAILSALIPPMQSPDENDHIKRAYLLSALSPTVTEPGRSTGGYFDDALQQYQVLNFQALSTKPQARFDAKTAADGSAIRWSGVRHYVDMAGAAPYFPLGYLPAAIGLRIGESLDLGVGASYRLARAVTLITIATIIAYAFTIFCPNALVICILALPMTMFQMSSASADGMSFAWTVLAASLFRRGMEKEEPFPLWWSVLLIVASFMISTSRPQLIAILVLAPVVFLVRNDRRALAASLIAALLAVGWVLYGASHTVDLRWPRSVTTGQVVALYLHHPIELVKVVWRTLSNPAILDSYWRQFVGVLGWLDRPMPPITYKLAGVGLIVALALSCSRRVGAFARTVPLLVAASAVLLTLVALLITWTDQPAKLIIGVQGRYFTAPAILAAYALSSRYIGDQRSIARLVVCGVFIVASVSMTVSTLIWKYYL